MHREVRQLIGRFDLPPDAGDVLGELLESFHDASSTSSPQPDPVPPWADEVDTIIAPLVGRLRLPRPGFRNAVVHAIQAMGQRSAGPAAGASPSGEGREDAAHELCARLELPSTCTIEVRRLATRWLDQERRAGSPRRRSDLELVSRPPVDRHDTGDWSIEDGVRRVADEYGIASHGFVVACAELLAAWTGRPNDIADRAGAHGPIAPDAVGLIRPHGLGERYLDSGLLGTGGMGQVRRVVDRQLGRVVALKVMRPELAGNDRMVRRFVAEAQATGQLQHPGVVPVYEIGVLHDGRPYFTMREIKGRDLGYILDEVLESRNERGWGTTRSGWTLRRVIDTLKTVCETVAFAHARGVIHRDLKPENVMVGSYGQVLLVDWGLSRVVGTAAGPDDGSEEQLVAITADGSVGLSQSGRVTGTPAYMPPEQARGDVAAQGPHSDVYALGAMLFEVLAGVPPHDTGDAALALEMVLAGSPLTLPEDPHIPEPLREICHRALAPEPGDRYADARELADALADWLEGARRRDEALALLNQAREKSAACARLRTRADALRRSSEAQLEDQGPAESTDAWTRVAQARKLDEGAETLDVVVLQLARAALARFPELPEAHALLADHYRRNHASAEARGQAALVERYRVLLQAHDNGRYGDYLEGDGALTLYTDPPGATVELFRYVDRGRRLATQPMRQRLPTPIKAMTLPMGSYLLTIHREGHVAVRVPVHIGRQEHWDGVPPEGGVSVPVVLPVAGALGPDEVYVPGGWCLVGDENAPNSPPRQRVWVDPFVIQRNPVTVGQYLGFLNTLVDAGLDDEARVRVPKIRGLYGVAGRLLFTPDANGRYQPRADTPGLAAGYPVTLVSWDAAAAYASWSAASLKLPYRLPTELEWEKAARGVDGRLFPWGSHFEPDWCCVQGSTEATHPSPIGSFPRDVSPYGVRGMAGNVRDWCRDGFRLDGPLIEGGRAEGGRLSTPYRAVRGGAWLGARDDALAASRHGRVHLACSEDVGFRLVRPLKRDG